MPHINFKNCSNYFVGLALLALLLYVMPVSVADATSVVGGSGVVPFGGSGTIDFGGVSGGSKGAQSQSSSGNCKSATELCNPLKFSSFGEFFTGLLHIIVIFAIPIIILMIIYSGFMYVMARGSEEQVTKATRSLTYAVLGGLIILGAELILQVIQGTVSQLTI